MTLIEGVGDEVIHFFLLLAIAFIALLAWWSTNLSERPLIRTVFIVERRTIRQTPFDNQAITAEVTENNDTSSERNEIQTERKTSHSSSNANDQIQNNIIKQCQNGEALQSDLSRSEVSQGRSENSESDSGGQANISEAANKPTIQRRRIVFLETGIEEQKDISEESECVRNIAEANTLSDDCKTESKDDGNIRIRLKYLNDDQKLVEGKLQEQLGDFKRRHFSLELAGRKLVRLIFNGQVLQEDTKTLQNCGFFDNCVVHCLVHSRTPPPSPNLNRPRNETQTQNETSHHWDLGNILFASLSLLLGLAWYGRYQYAQLYTATTTVALVGLTGIFTVSLIGMYMPDTDGVRT